MSAVAIEPILGGVLGRRRLDLSVTARAAFVIVVTVVAYHHSLETLARNLTLDTPLAYLALVPLIAIGLGIAAWRRDGFGPDIHDRQLDYIVGIPLVAAALLSHFLLPTQMSVLYWVRRLDMLSLPLFVAGLISLTFGFRGLVRLKAAVAFLFLAWPYPYTLGMYRWLDGFTQFTSGIVATAASKLSIGTRIPGAADALFSIPSAKPFQLSIVSACSGANSLVGFLLLGTAVLTLARGSLWRKLLWITIGSLVCIAFNVGRILLVFWVGTRWGESVAIDSFHPYIGLVMFVVAFGGMMLLLRPLGLTIGSQRPAGPDQTRHMTLPKPGASLGIAVVAAALLFVMNGDLNRFSLVADSLGTPRLVSFTTRPTAVEGWKRPARVTQYDWTKRFFGQNSRWVRYNLLPKDATPTAADQIWTSGVVIADVITTDDLSRLDTYGLEACYNFHNYKVSDPVTAKLGGGVTGTSLHWTDSKKQAYTVVYWHWPVRQGKKTLYERVTLLMRDDPAFQFRSPGVDLSSPSVRINDAFSRGILDPVQLSERERITRQFLVSLAREMVRNQPAVAKSADSAA